MKELKSLSDINTSTSEGRYLMAAIVKLSGTRESDKHPDEILQQCGRLQEEIYVQSEKLNQ